MIYDDPNHPHYGPVRRLHIMVMQLFGDDLPWVEKEFLNYVGLPWPEDLSRLITNGFSEAQAQRNTLRSLLALYGQFGSTRGK